MRTCYLSSYSASHPQGCNKISVSVNVGLRIDAGKLFQTRGPLTANDQSPKDVQFRQVRRRSKAGPAVADQAAVISQISWCTPVEALVDEDRQLKQNLLPDW